MTTRPIHFDLFTQRFIVNRWNTPVGREVRDRVIERIHAGEPIIDVLESCVLKHPDNVAPREFPYYPPDAIKENEFWVLSDDDLRGIHFYDEDFSNAIALARKNLSYSSFNRCTLNNVSFEYSDIANAKFILLNRIGWLMQ